MRHRVSLINLFATWLCSIIGSTCKVQGHTLRPGLGEISVLVGVTERVVLRDSSTDKDLQSDPVSSPSPKAGGIKCTVIKTIWQKSEANTRPQSRSL